MTALLVSLEEAKAYLKIEYDEEDDLLLSLIASAEDLCATILRKDLPEDDTVRVAVLYAVSYLFDSRGETNMTDLVEMLKAILSGKREAVF
ncbi:head-tail connector protein [Evtepia sp.]|uniref:head-tail connector protein n=1 Tax=Evtepia sp. TaxID=2773933 RepID=UPI003990C442